MWVYNPKTTRNLVHELACLDSGHLLFGSKRECGLYMHIAGWFALGTVYFGAISNKPWFGLHTRFSLVDSLWFTFTSGSSVDNQDSFCLVFFMSF